MRSSLQLLSTFVARQDDSFGREPLRSGCYSVSYYKIIFIQVKAVLLSIMLIFLFSTTNSFAQNYSSNNLSTTTILNKFPDTTSPSNKSFQGIKLTPQQKKKRIFIVAAGNIIGYGGAMIGLSSAWYSQYEKTKFHTFNDFPEWKQVDKVGHFYAAYIESRASMEMWRWTGIDRKKRIWIGGMSGAVYQTVIEFLDGHSSGWGWSWGDFGANIIGSGTLVAQELAWNEQRIKIKFSFHKKNYADAKLDQRSDELFGKSWPERMLKDYNGQTYWASVNLKPFFKNSKIPDWLSVSIGYGADGMFGATQNISKDENGNVIFDRSDLKRYRQWFIAPDIDLTKIKTNKKGLKFLFTVLSAFKFPTPSLELSNGKLKVHALHF